MTQAAIHCVCKLEQRTGTRNPLESWGISDHSETGGSESGAPSAEQINQRDSQSPNAIDDPELAAIVEVWPSLPPAIRADITALVQSNEPIYVDALGNEPIRPRSLRISEIGAIDTPYRFNQLWTADLYREEKRV